LNGHRRESPAPRQLSAVWADIARHPYEYLVCRWNWKAGAVSAAIRGSIYFATNLGAGRDAALAAMLTEFGYRTLLSGAVGSVTQALRECEPAWAAALTALAVLPLAGHAVELTVHSLQGTPRLGISVAASVGFTVVSTLFNLYAMRRGVLVVGTRSRTLLEDLAAMPRLIVDFVTIDALRRRAG
jgi:hypothetical protein